MITAEQHQIIEKYVNPDYFDVDKLTRYLEMHDIVGNEVFQYCDRHKRNPEVPTYSNWLDDEYGYLPLPVDKFIRRVPFYFFVRERDRYQRGHTGTLHHIYSASVIDDPACERFTAENIERIYTILEYAFYDLELPLDGIFGYWIGQTGQVSGDTFFQWYDYLKLCEGRKTIDYFPDRFITAYNVELERHGRSPIIYEVQDMMMHEYYYRHGTEIDFEGQFPCDQNGNPIMKWIGIKAVDVQDIRCHCENSKVGRLSIKLTPRSLISLLNVYNNPDEAEDHWYQVYAGPMRMEFDYTVLKAERKKLKFTQQDVADAVDATVRTYQKWENGETTPDGHYLLRLMNWLDIPDVQSLVKYADQQSQH